MKFIQLATTSDTLFALDQNGDVFTCVPREGWVKLNPKRFEFVTAKLPEPTSEIKEKKKRTRKKKEESNAL